MAKRVKISSFSPGTAAGFDTLIDHKMLKVMMQKTIHFVLNGKEYTVPNKYDPNFTLAEFIRNVAGLKGTKVTCDEGGCGSCMVAVTSWDPLTKSNKTKAINSCLCPIYAVHGWHVVTVEGLGNERDGFHPIQERIADYNGSQCGYCTPGMVMSMYSLAHEKSQISKEDIENSLDGNICRCTGYRSVLDAFKSLSCEGQSECVDIENLQQTLVHKAGQPCGASCADLRKTVCVRSGEPCSGSCNAGHGKEASTLLLRMPGTSWYRPSCLEAMSELLSRHGRDKIGLIFGNTASGLYQDGPYDVYIDMHDVHELYNTMNKGMSIQFGSNLTLSVMIEKLEEYAEEGPGYEYFREVAKHIKEAGNRPVRNAGTWAGNLMLKRTHPEFPSDIFTILEASNAVLTIGCFESQNCYSLLEFMKLDMRGKAILCVELPRLDSDVIFKTYRVAQRTQNAHAYINAGFKFRLDKSTYSVKEKPAIVFGGINWKFVHAKKTEIFLSSKCINDQQTIQEAIEVLQSEVTPDWVEIPVLPSIKYRRELVSTLLYKFFLSVLHDSIPPELRSGMESLIRPESVVQQKSETKADTFSLAEPMPNMPARLQDFCSSIYPSETQQPCTHMEVDGSVYGEELASGEARFVDDIPPLLGELHASFVTSAFANAQINKIDPSDALKTMDGVVAVITSQDLPTNGTNNFISDGTYIEEIISSGDIHYAGQPLAMVIAETQSVADLAAAKHVKVTYKNKQPPIIDIQEAINHKSFHETPGVEDTIIGNPQDAMSSAVNVVSGEVQLGSQYHFFLENMVAQCVPTGDRMEVKVSTQSPAAVQKSVAMAVGKPMHKINIEVPSQNAASGNKQNSHQYATACAVAAEVMRCPVRMCVNMHTNMAMAGKRFPLFAQYKVGLNQDSRITVIELEIYVDCGHLPNQIYYLNYISKFLDGGYKIPNWHVKMFACKTHTPVNTAVKSPVQLPAQFIMETIMEHVCRERNKDPVQLRELHLYHEGDVSITGVELNYCSLRRVWGLMKESAELEARQADVETFNRENRWKKRGLSVMPAKCGMWSAGFNHTCFVSVYTPDGTVAVAHGGAGMGQNINAKIAQTAARALGIPVSYIDIKPYHNLTAPSVPMSDDSATEDLCSQGVEACCAILNERLAPFRSLVPEGDWVGLVQKCKACGIDLSAEHLHVENDTAFRYFTYGACATEVEVDILTGEYLVRRVDLIYDCGDSSKAPPLEGQQDINPCIDVGQVEGSFVMGMGYFMLERVIYDPRTGKNLTTGTWEYKPPSPKDIPIDFRVQLLKDAPNPAGLMGTKGAGEPPILMSPSVLLAIRSAMEKSREERDVPEGLSGNTTCPYTVETIQQSCEVSKSHMVLA